MSRTLSVKSSWQRGTAGGCPKNEGTYAQNPQFVLNQTVPTATYKIELTQQPTGGPSLHLIGIVVMTNKPGKPFPAKIGKKKLIGKTSYKAVQTTSLEVTLGPPETPGNDYVILPCTFEPEQYASFTLTVSSEDDAGFTVLPRGEKSRVEPTPPTGLLKPDADETLAAAIKRMEQEPSTDGRFDDSEFRVRASGPGGKEATNAKVLYVSGAAGPSAVKVDSWGRTSAMGGKGPSTEFATPGSLMVHRRALSDLWLLGALGMVQTRSDLLERVFGYANERDGMHAVRLWKDGAWRTVVVDDQIPCHGKLKPAYSTNDAPRDGPVALVEKALSKLYGCYEHLKQGRVGSALEDLTGGYKDKLYLVDGVTSQDGTISKQPDIGAAAEIDSGIMWARLVALQGDNLLGAAYKQKYAHLSGPPAIDPSNLEGSETLVYPILELKQLTPAQGGLQFVKLRNPWKQIGELAGPAGKARDWEGAWGNSAADWQNQPGAAKELGGKPRPSEGAFWMPFEEFVRGFNKVGQARTRGWCGRGGRGGRGGRSGRGAVGRTLDACRKARVHGRGRGGGPPSWGCAMPGCAPSPPSPASPIRLRPPTPTLPPPVRPPRVCAGVHLPAAR